MKRRDFWIYKYVESDIEGLIYESPTEGGLHVREVLLGEDEMIKELVEALEFYANAVEPDMKKSYDSAIAILFDESNRDHIRELKLPATMALDKYKKVLEESDDK